MRPQELPLILVLPLLESSFYPSHTTVISPAAVGTRMHTTQFKARFYLAVQSASAVFDLTSFGNVLTSLGPALLLPSVYFLVSFVGSLRLLAPRLVVFPSALPSLHGPCLSTRLQGRPDVNLMISAHLLVLACDVTSSVSPSYCEFSVQPLPASHHSPTSMLKTESNSIPP